MRIWKQICVKYELFFVTAAKCTKLWQLIKGNWGEIWSQLLGSGSAIQGLTVRKKIWTVISLQQGYSSTTVIVKRLPWQTHAMRTVYDCRVRIYRLQFGFISFVIYILLHVLLKSIFSIVFTLFRWVSITQTSKITMIEIYGKEIYTYFLVINYHVYRYNYKFIYAKLYTYSKHSLCIDFWDG